MSLNIDHYFIFEPSQPTMFCACFLLFLITVNLPIRTGSERPHEFVSVDVTAGSFETLETVQLVRLNCLGRSTSTSRCSSSIFFSHIVPRVFVEPFVRTGMIKTWQTIRVNRSCKLEYCILVAHIPLHKNLTCTYYLLYYKQSSVPIHYIFKT